MPELHRLDVAGLKRRMGHLRAMVKQLDGISEMVPPEIRRTVAEAVAIGLADCDAVEGDNLRLRGIISRNKSAFDAVKAELVETRAERDALIIELAQLKGEGVPPNLRARQTADRIMDAVIGASIDVTEPPDTMPPPE